MKYVRITLWSSLALLFLLILVTVWFCTGSFEFEGAQKKEFRIDQPLSVVCKRAMSAKDLPQTEDGTKTTIDMKKAVKSFSFGEPIECYVDHPVLGKLRILLKITISIDNGVVTLRGETCSIEPNQIRKNGMNVADLEQIRFALSIQAADFEPGGFMNLLPSTGYTILNFESSTALNVHFRECGFVRSIVEKEILHNQQNVLNQIEAFIQNVILVPAADETPKEPTKKSAHRLSSFIPKPFKRSQTSAEEEPAKADASEESDSSEEIDLEDVDLSALDEDPDAPAEK